MDFCNEAVFAFRAKKPLHAGVRTGCHHSISPSVCVTFVILTDCESCTRPISTISGSIEAGKNGLTRGTCFFARCLEVLAVAGLLKIQWYVLGGADFSFFTGNHIFKFVDPAQSASTRRRGADSQPNLPIAKSRPPTKCTVYCAPT